MHSDRAILLSLLENSPLNDNLRELNIIIAVNTFTAIKSKMLTA